jgi:hypothetical protein
MANEPFFRIENGLYQPTDVGRGPWDPKSLHGRLIAGLLGAEIERLHGDPDFIPARLTTDMYRLPDLSPVEVKTSVVREGRRIKVVDAEFISGGKSAGRATCQFLRKGEAPGGTVWKPEPWAAPHPDDIQPPDDARAAMGGMWAIKPISGGFGTVGKKQIWMSEVREVVEGRPLTPFVRVAVASDFVSPFAHAGSEGLKYINSDITVYLHREMRGEWLGFEVTDHGATDGVAVGETRLYDVDGPIGLAACCALVQARPVS